MPGKVGRPSRYAFHPGPCLARLLLGQAEVEHLDVELVAHHHIVWLEVAVDDAPLVRRDHRARDPDAELQRVAEPRHTVAEHATQRQFVYSHQWRVGDLVMWDNRATMHRARRYEDEKYPRDLRRTTLTDGVPTVEQRPAAAA